ncbi:LysM peptidoglycan-binding domain-containing M23 family metallopeptidase [Eilatimonas milleporae]|uniref:Murein DD-endopeptidase MepM/ murein hydrolase activator NlpD n=1 Tax=Eilatimonas milleporae TaxID=911205 RepID=A0A3M0C721_9PROT|nr:LysM peptidoglycan-binding domain-containing M23 family metallopeptidase [Eilatimonas milleporae]RMB05022.1 murein DD-endopeptidase MepM/ murein hydrolase activator NlpD [Eilatimonas milleporae]
MAAGSFIRLPAPGGAGIVGAMMHVVISGIRPCLSRAVRVAAVGALIFLTACGSAPGRVNPADIKPVYQVRNAPVPVPYPAVKPKVSAVQARARKASGGRITVARGDTLYSLSRRYGVPLRGVVAANGLAPPYRLAVGQRLRLPAPAVHTVRKGETGYSISRRYGVTVSSLMRENSIRPPYTLAIGQTLRLPGGAGTASKTVKTVATPSASPSASSGPSRSKPASTTPPTRTESQRVPGVKATPPPRAGARFGWPVKGRIASRFGPRAGGIHNDGINILARQGSPVRAAESGVVVYASNALQGYGNLLLLKHDGGWITAYAHNERLLVQAGQQVTRGDVIARVGRTGGVSEPQLHFEIRKGRRALDPLGYMEAGGQAG